MPCDTAKLPNGGVAIVCSARRKATQCAFCRRPHTRLCDGSRQVLDAGVSKTVSCDRPICDRCTWSPENDKDYCPACAPEEQSRRSREGARQ